MFDYLQTNGLYSSRTFFVLLTEGFSGDLLLNEFAEETGGQTGETNIETPSNETSIKRKICGTCHRTYTTDNCFGCVQDGEYAASLAIDAARAESVVTLPETVINIPESDANLPPFWSL